MGLQTERAASAETPDALQKLRDACAGFRFRREGYTTSRPYVKPYRIAERREMPEPKEKPRHIGLVKAEKPDLKRLIQSEGFAKVPNDISDVLIPELKLDPYEQAVLQRLIRETRGWQRMTCTTSYSKLAKYTNVARSRVQEAVETLSELGLVEILGSSQAGTTFRVLPGVSVPQGGIPHGGTPVPRGGTQKPRSVPHRGKIKEKGVKETKKDTDTELERLREEYERNLRELTKCD